MKAALGSLSVVALVATVFAAEPKPEPPKSSAKKLQGTWNVEAISLGGKRGGAMKFPAKVKMSVTITADTWTFRTEADGDANTADYTVTLDASKKPARIDMVGTNGGKKSTVAGIYEF